MNSNNTDSKRELVQSMLAQGLLLSPEMVEGNLGLDNSVIEQIRKKGIIYVNEKIISNFSNSEANWNELEHIKAISQLTGDTRSYDRFIEFLDSKKQDSSVKVISNFEEGSSKKEIGDFVLYFNARLDFLQRVLYSRDELKGVVSISRILSKKERETVAAIGLVIDKQTTKNENIMITIEDSTGEIKVLINKNKPEMYDLAKELVLDEVIGIVGVNADKIIFANNLILPDIPVTNELKKSGEEGYALFLSDIHVGSNNFLEQDFEKFLSWLNQSSGNDSQKEVASKVKYIFVIGDLVDGVGVYPGQEEDLVIKDIYEQYDACAKLLARIPKHIKIILSPGNHDVVRMAEPQPALSEEYCKELCSLPNVIMVSNPGIVNIHSSENFPGYNVLMYHGYSFDYYVANVDTIRNNGGYDRADLIMKFLLRRRHLAPTHTSTLYVPTCNKDPLVIETIPDIFATGHIHKSSVSHYRNITLISGSTWQAKTAFQEKLGHNPEPSRVPIVNLATREVKVLRFGK